MTAKPLSKSTKPLFLNRELSWIEFNSRVLAQAEDATLPALERLKFIAITSSNADEFFMVRVGGLKFLQKRGKETPDPAGLEPSVQLAEISSRMHALVERQHQCLLKEIEPRLRKGGIRRLRISELNTAQRRHVDSMFKEFIFPVVSPIAVHADEPFPLLAGLGLALYVRLEGETPDSEFRHALVGLPKGLARFLTVPSDTGFSYILLEEVIRARMEKLFPGVPVKECAVFRITRNADMSVRDDLAGDLLVQMREVLSERQESDCVRLEVEKRTSKAAVTFLQQALSVGPADIYRVSGPLNLAAFFRLANLPGYDGMKLEPWAPQTVPEVTPNETMFEILKRENLLLFHPYETYDPIVRLVQEASEDPTVLAIKQVLYRVSDKSPVVAALIRAAERGKHVTALIELKARFDEARNIDWADALEHAGAQVIYGVKGYKTHAKVCVIVRREPEGVVRYIHYGTGNYNEKTARLYSDVSFMTSEKDYGADASVFFNTLTGYSQLTSFLKIEAAPLGIRPKLLDLIAGEIEHKRQGEPASMEAKMNSLADPKLIEALYRASQAGVKIRLSVRGICCLRPGVKGLSDNIMVFSVVDRYLEHARIFRFTNGGEPRLFLSSADWMPRNLDRRIELMVPVEDEAGKEKLTLILNTCLADTRQAWRLKSTGAYERRKPDTRNPDVRSQAVFQQKAEAAAAASVQKQVPVFEPQRPAEKKKSP